MITLHTLPSPIRDRIWTFWRGGVGIRRTIVQIARQDLVRLKFEDVQPEFARLADEACRRHQ